MKMRNIPSFIAAFILVLGAGTAAADDHNKADVAATKYRQAIFRVVYGNFGPLAGMARGQRDYDANEVRERASRILMLSGMLEEAFQRDTREAKVKSDALGDIWDNYDDFVMKTQNFSEASKGLASAAAEGEDAFKAAFRKTAGTCKGCHDEYRAE